MAASLYQNKYVTAFKNIVNQSIDEKIIQYLPHEICVTTFPISSKTFLGLISWFVELCPSCPYPPAPNVNTPPSCYGKKERDKKKVRMLPLQSVPQGINCRHITHGWTPFSPTVHILYYIYYIYFFSYTFFLNNHCFRREQFELIFDKSILPIPSYCVSLLTTTLLKSVNSTFNKHLYV